MDTFALITRLLLREKNKIKKINNDITIKDVVITENPRKEKNYPALISTCSVEAFVKQIKAMSRLVNRVHEADNMEMQGGKLIVKANHENQLTRLITNEFLFYPKDRPLNLTEFETLLIEIEKLAKQWHKNLILVLSSFPIYFPNRGIQNYVIHVQCGPHPIIQSFAKIVPSSIDPDYPGTSHVPYAAEGSPKGNQNRWFIFRKKNEIGPQLVYHKQKDKGGVNYNVVVEIETVGGAKLLNILEICLDHTFGEGLKGYQYKLKNEADYLPMQISHVVTSRTVNLMVNNLVTMNVTQADPFRLANLELDFDEYEWHVHPHYSLIVKTLPPIKAERASSQYEKLINQHNMDLMHEKMRQITQSNAIKIKNFEIDYKKLLSDVSSNLTEYKLKLIHDLKPYSPHLFTNMAPYQKIIEHVDAYLQDLASKFNLNNIFSKELLAVSLIQFKEQMEALEHAQGLVEIIDKILGHSLLNNISKSYQTLARID